MSDNSSSLQEVHSQVDAALDTVYARLVEAVPGSEEHLKTAEAKTAVPPKYLVGAGLVLLALAVVGLLMMLDLHTLVLQVFFWLALSYRSFRAIDNAQSGAVTTPAQSKELKHLLAYSVVSCAVVSLGPLLNFIPGWIYIKYVTLTLAYYADKMDDALVTLLKNRVVPLVHQLEGAAKKDD